MHFDDFDDFLETYFIGFQDGVEAYAYEDGYTYDRTDMEIIWDYLQRGKDEEDYIW